MKAYELMHKRAECLSATTPITAIARKMKEDGIGAVVIIENGQLVGMVTDRDLICRAIAGGRDLSKVTARDVMTKGLVCCHETDEAEEARRLMKSRHVHRLAVLDQNKGMVGMLRLEDVSDAAKEDQVGINSGFNDRLYESLATLNTEWIEFINRRLAEDFAVPQQLAECKTIQDTWAVYGAFWQKASQHYLQAIQRLTNVGLGIVAGESTGGCRGQGSRPLEDFAGAPATD